MSSTLQLALATIQQNDYVSRMFIFTHERDRSHKFVTVAVITAVGYDYGELQALL